MNKIIDITPATPIQTGLLSRSAMVVGVYVEQYVERKTNINLNLLKKAWNIVVNRYDALKVAFKIDNNGEIFRLVMDEIKIPFSERHTDLFKAIEMERSISFEWKDAPLMRLCFVKISSNEYHLIWTYHHALLDAWSSAIVLRDVEDTYNSLISEEQIITPKRKPFRNYVAWLYKKNKDDAKDFWRKKFENCECSCFLPKTDKREGGFQEVDYFLSRLETAKLLQFTQENSITISTLVFGILGILIGRYLSKEEAIIGTTVSGRNIDLIGIDDMVGIFINTFPVKFVLRGSILNYLKSMQLNILNSSNYGYLPLSDILKNANSNLFNVLYSHENLEKIMRKKSDVIIREKSEYPLSIKSFIDQGNLVLHFGFDKSFFSEKVISRMFIDFKSALKHVRKHKEDDIRKIELLTKEEKKKILSPHVTYKKNKNIIDLFNQQVKKTPDAIALVHENSHISYNALNNKANQLAKYLRKRNIHAEVPIAVDITRTTYLIISLLGVLKAGGIFVPIDISIPKKRLQHMAFRILLTTSRSNGIPKNIPYLQVDKIPFTDESVDDLYISIHPLQTAYIIYTSGSTGVPKGISVTHMNVFAKSVAISNGYSQRADDICIAYRSLTFDAAFEDAVIPLFSGTKIVLFQGNIIEKTRDFEETIRRQLVSFIKFVPTLWNRVKDKIVPYCRSKIINKISFGGEVLNVDSNDLSDDVTYFNVYGPAETTIDVTMCIFTKKSVSKSIGSPLCDNVYLLNRQLNLASQNEQGEICISGIGVARGYLNRPDLTAEKFIANPFGNGDRIYLSGDIAERLESGELMYISRLDNQVKIRGIRIEPSEIAIAIKHCSNVKNSLVVAKDYAGNKQLAAYIVPIKKTTSLADKVFKEIKTILPEYMLPNHIIIVDDIPMLSNGKVDLTKLSTLDDSPMKKYVSPKNGIEKQLCKIWEKVLGLKKVSVIDDFFRIGGDSILAIQIVSEAKKNGLLISVSNLMENSTIKKLSKITRQTNVQDQEIEVYKNRSMPSKLATPLQCGLIFYYLYKGNESSVYHTQNIIYLNRLSVDTLKKSWILVTNKYSALRHEFIWGKNDHITFRVRSSVELPFLEIDLEKSKFTDLNSVISVDEKLHFHLDKAPLFRVTVIKISDDDFVMIWTFHHIILDGWSSAIILKDLFKIYSTLSKGINIKLEKEVPSCNYNNYINKLERTTAETFWREYLSDPEYEAIPIKSSIDSNPCYCDFHKIFDVDVKKLKDFCKNKKLTINTVLIGCFGIALTDYFKIKKVLIGLTVSGRDVNVANIEKMVGLFINTLPLKLHQNFEQLQKDIQNLSQYSYVSLSEIQKWTDSPLFNIQYAYENYPIDEGLNKIIKDRIVIEKTEYPLSISLWIKNNKIHLNTVYDTSRIHEFNPQQLFNNFEKNINLSMNGGKVNSTGIERSESIAGLFEKQVEKTPDAIVTAFKNLNLTYKKLDELSNFLARKLVSISSHSCPIIGVCVSRSPDVLIGILSILKMGGAYVPLDPTYPTKRLQYMINDAGLRIILTTSDLTGIFEDLSQFDVIYLDKLNRNEKTHKLAQSISYLNLAAVVYTSGSTGFPKGTMLNHQGIINHLNSKIKYLEINDKTVIAQTSKLSFVVSIWQYLAGIICGARCAIIDDKVVLDVVALRHELRRKCISILEETPLMIDIIFQEVNLPQLKYLVSTGEALSSKICSSIVKKLKHIKFTNAYGFTEVSDDVLHYQIDHHKFDLKGIVPIGYPLLNTRMYIVDDDIVMVPVGEIGEICVSSIGIAFGYLGKSDLTAEKFVANPFERGKRLYKTGDLGRYLADGSIEYVGRIDDQVKIRGFRIELCEIESTINLCDEVKTSAVVLQESEEQKRLIAFVVPEARNLNNQTSQKIIQNIRNKITNFLPNYMIPNDFMMIPEMPLTPNGKVDKRSLKSLKMNDSASDKIAPTNKIQETLCRIWKEVLRVGAVGIKDDFFKLGGDSITAIRIISRIKRENFTLTIKELFSYKTIEEISKIIHRRNE